MNQKQLQKIREEFKGDPYIDWIEPAGMIRGFIIKVGYLTSKIIKKADRLGYHLRHASVYTLDKDYLIAAFEPKEIEA